MVNKSKYLIFLHKHLTHKLYYNWFLSCSLFTHNFTLQNIFVMIREKKQTQVTYTVKLHNMNGEQKIL